MKVIRTASSLTRDVLTLTPVGVWGSTGGLGVGEVEGRDEAVVEGGVTTAVVESATEEVEVMTGVLGATSEILGVMTGILVVTTGVLASTSEGLDSMTGVLGASTVRVDCTS